MDEFLSSFEENKQNETEQLYNTRRTIVSYLEIISKVLWDPILKKKDLNEI